MSETRECLLCHRIGYRDFHPMHSEGWACNNDRACKERAERRAVSDDLD